MTLVSLPLGRIGLAVSTALVLALPAMAQPQPGDRRACHPGLSRLTVTGTGESRVAPDMASIQMGVTTQAASAAEAMRLNSTQQAAVIDALIGAGIEQGDIQTSGLNLNPVMDYGEGRAPTVTGYQASNMVTVRVRDVPRLGEVLDSIVSAGANEINGITFLRDDNATAEDDARRAAVEDARHKAGVLAEAAGLTLGPVLILRDSPVAEGPRPMMMEARAAADSAPVPIAAGEIATTATVEMQFALTGQDCEPMGRGMGHPHGHHGDAAGHGSMHGRMHGGMSGGMHGMRDSQPSRPGDMPTDPSNDSEAPDGEAASPMPGDLPPSANDALAPDTEEPDSGMPADDVQEDVQPPVN